ncbi:MAG: hypothetical protein V2A56_01545 [bacterium]
MRGNVGVILILLLMVLLLWFVGYLSDHDRVVRVDDVNTVVLRQGRTVHLIGLAPSAIYADVVSVLPDSTLETEVRIVGMDTSSINRIAERVIGQPVILDYSKAFAPDTASPDLHVYMRLEDGSDLGAWILSQGLAKVNPEHQHPREVDYASFQAESKLNHLGIWAVPDTVAVLEEEAMPVE